jgi:lysophospholipase L1-like esterase
MFHRTILLLTLLFVGGCDLVRNPAEPTLPDTVVNYTAIGASDAIGFGGSSPCFPLVDCTTGTGYVQQVAQRLTAAGKTVTLYNVGIPGAVLSPALQDLGNSLGRDIFGNLLDGQAPYVRRDSTLVTFFAGGNDANVIGAAIRAGRGGSDIAGYVATQVQAFGTSVRAMVQLIRTRAPDARIIGLNLPNMAAMPYAGGLTIDEKRWLQTIAVGLSAEVNKVQGGNVLVLDLMCDTTFYNPAVLSGDGFHPNDTGYTHMANLVYDAVTTGTAPVPRASCAQMGIF